MAVVTNEAAMETMNAMFKLYGIDAFVTHDGEQFVINYNIHMPVRSVSGRCYYDTIPRMRRGVKALINLNTMPLTYDYYPV
jgi:hypothetical protein